MLCWGLTEQARREHMSQENINTSIFVDVPSSPLLLVHYGTDKRGIVNGGTLASQMYII